MLVEGNLYGVLEWLEERGYDMRISNRVVVHR